MKASGKLNFKQLSGPGLLDRSSPSQHPVPWGPWLQPFGAKARVHDGLPDEGITCSDPPILERFNVVLGHQLAKIDLEDNPDCMAVELLKGLLLPLAEHRVVYRRAVLDARAQAGSQ